MQRATTAPFRAIDYDFTVTGPADVIGHVERVFAAFAAPVVARHHCELEVTDEGWILFADGERVGRSATPARAITYLMWHVNRSAVASVGDRIVLHAAAASRGGRAVLLAGPENAGKTTLVTALGQAGMQYLTDEAVLVDPATATAHAYPKPLSLEPGSWPLFPELAPTGGFDGWEREVAHLAPDRLAGGLGTACPVEHIVLVRYDPEAETKLTPLRRVETMVALVEQTFGFPRLGAEGLRGLAALVQSATCHRLEGGRLDDACRLVLDLVGSTMTASVGR